MILGEVQSGNGSMIYWQPDEATKEINKMRYTKRSVEKHGGIILSKHQYNISDPLVAYKCSNCQKIIIKYSWLQN